MQVTQKLSLVSYLVWNSPYEILKWGNYFQILFNDIMYKAGGHWAIFSPFLTLRPDLDGAIA